MKRLAILATLALAACGSGAKDANGDGIVDSDPRTPDTVTEVAPSSPKGRVSGRVQSVQGAPLAGVEVALSGWTEGSSAPKSVFTDANGFFVADHLTGGSTIGLFFSLAGYAPASTTATIPGATGNFPLSDAERFIGTVSLLPLGGTLDFYVVGYDGKPIDGVTATLDVTPGFLLAESGQAVGHGDFPVSGAIVAGQLSFANVPRIEDVAWLENAGIEVRYAVYVPPVFGADGKLAYSGKTFDASALDLLTHALPTTLVLPAPAGGQPLAILATNVENLLSCPSLARENLVAKSGAIAVVFNQPISSGDLRVEIRNDEAARDDSLVIPLNPAELSSIGTALSITAQAPGFAEGMKYNLVLEATPRDAPAAAPVRFSAPFFGGDPANPRPLGTPVVRLIEGGTPNGAWDPSEPLRVLFDKYLGRTDDREAQIPAYLDNDLNGSGKVGDSTGELGAPAPLCLRAAEAIPNWLEGAKASGYARTYLLDTSKAPVPGYTTPLSAAALRLSLAFSEAYKCTGPVYSVWGEPLSGAIDDLPVVPQ